MTILGGLYVLGLSVAAGIFTLKAIAQHRELARRG